MTTDPAGWPDPARPGVPLNPERDGWHWLKHPEDLRPFPSAWNAELRGWPSGALHSPQGIVDLGFAYLGPCYTQADLDAAVQAAARVGDIAVNQNAEMRDQLREIDEAVVALSKIVIGEGVLPAGNYPGAAPMLNHLHDTIRSRGPTPALTAALAAAEERGFQRGFHHPADVDKAMTAALAQARREGAVAGWNACRKSIYAVCEDVQNEADRLDDGTKDTPQHHFLRGQRYIGKSIARGFCAMEPEHDDNLIAAIRSAAAGEEGK